MNDFHCLYYLDGQPSLPGLPRWTTFTAWITWMGLYYLDGQPSLPGLPGWMTFTAWITWMDNLQCLDCLDG
eukprot:4186559-Karenia_brevis.AAC.1